MGFFKTTEEYEAQQQGPVVESEETTPQTGDEDQPQSFFAKDIDKNIGENIFAIDADTFYDRTTGQKYRLPSVDAKEVGKIVDGKVKHGEHGGIEQTQAIVELANKYGYTIVKPRLDANGNPVLGERDRIIADLVDENGNSFSERLIREQVVGLHGKYSTNEDLKTRNIGENIFAIDADTSGL